MKTLSPQQAAAVSAVAAGAPAIVVEAVAGAGKTSTIFEMVKATSGRSAICAYSHAIKVEIEQKAQKMGLNCNVGTVHSFGLGSIRRAFNVKVDGYKLERISEQEFNGEYEDLRPFVKKATEMAKQWAIGAILDNEPKVWAQMCEHHNIWDLLPEKYTVETAIDAAQYLLAQSNGIKHIIDFDDMVYFPILHNLKVWQYDNVFLDEAQDTNNARRALVKKMIKKGGQFVAVGDPHQAIFGFTGANADSLDIIKREFQAQTLPLSVTFRCPKEVVKVANQWVSHIESHPDSPDGVVDSCTLQEIATQATKDDVVICRLTKPLVELAYSLLRQNVACKVEGREIGQGLVRLATRWKRIKTVGELYAKLSQWSEAEIKKYEAKKDNARCQGIEDRVKTLEVFMGQCDDSDSIATLCARIEGLFGDTKKGESQRVLTLSTIHRSKGREWDRVFALGMETYSPSKWAEKAWEVEQEDNLCYVQVTRAKNRLTLVPVPAKDM
jgi:superfamily I DNA/RNA helicase